MSVQHKGLALDQRAADQRRRISEAFSLVSASSAEKQRPKQRALKGELTSVEQMIEYVLAALDVRNVVQLLAAKKGFGKLRSKVNAAASAALNFYEREDTRIDNLHVRLTLRNARQRVRLVSISGAPVLPRARMSTDDVYVLLEFDPASEVERVLSLAVIMEIDFLAGSAASQIERSMCVGRSLEAVAMYAEERIQNSQRQRTPPPRNRPYAEASRWEPDPTSRALCPGELETLLGKATESLTAMHTAQQERMQRLLESLLSESQAVTGPAFARALAKLLPKVLAIEPYPDSEVLYASAEGTDSNELQHRLDALPPNAPIQRHLLSMHLYFKEEREHLRDRQKEERCLLSAIISSLCLFAKSGESQAKRDCNSRESHAAFRLCANRQPLPTATGRDGINL